MEAGMSLDDLWMRLKPAAALSLNLFQFIEGGKDPIGQWLVRKRPEPFSRLHFWGIRRQEHQVDALRQCKSSTAVPAGTIQHQHDRFVWPCSHPPLAKAESRQGEDLTAFRGHEPPTRLPTLGMDKGKDIHPFIALGHRSFHRGSLGSPDAS